MLLQLGRGFLLPALQALHFFRVMSGVTRSSLVLLIRTNKLLQYLEIIRITTSNVNISF